MHTIRILAAALLLTWTQAHSQQPTSGHIETDVRAELSILQLIPDSFPLVGVSFKAEKADGTPVFGLMPDNMRVTEDGMPGEVVSLEPLSNYKPIHMCAVVDHSGSMATEDFVFEGDGKYYRMDSATWIIDPNPIKGYLPPIKQAKRALKSFFRSFDGTRDMISVVGFSSTTDKRLALTTDTKAAEKLVNSMDADFGTAFYDAVWVGIDEVAGKGGMPVVVALTDGKDNQSQHTLAEVIQKAKAADVPVYVVGLGSVDKPTLKRLAEETGGHFHYSKQAKALDAIYATISQQVQAFYHLRYRSPSLEGIDSLRAVELRFDLPGIALQTQADTFLLPAEVRARLSAQSVAQERDYLVYGGVATAVVAGSLVLLFAFRGRRRKAQPLALDIFPNPSDGQVQVTHGGLPGLIEVVDMLGRVVLSTSLGADTAALDLSALADGNYVAYFESGGQRSAGRKCVIRH